MGIMHDHIYRYQKVVLRFGLIGLGNLPLKNLLGFGMSSMLPSLIYNACQFELVIISKQHCGTLKKILANSSLPALLI